MDGRQSAVHPIVRKGFVQVLDVPEYIDPDLVHALPEPEFSHSLGSIAQLQKVHPTDQPAPGHCWYVVAKVRGRRCLRLWDRTYWPDGAKMTDADCTAFVSWWNTGVDA